MKLYDHQKDVIGKVFGGQADDVITRVEEHLPALPLIGAEVPVRVFMQVGEEPRRLIGEVAVTDRENHTREVADLLRALADEFDRAAT